jgi:transcriptional regulator with XRE-family HTH domain
MQTGEENKTPLERYLGITIRELRQRHGLTIAQVSAQAGISRGMLSKIENAQTSAGLEVLNRIAQALGVSLSMLFRNFDVPQGGAQLVKKGAGMEVVRKGTKRGHTYHLLAYDQGPRKLFEPFLITMEDEAERFPVFEHPGTEFIHMLKGVIEYR